METVADLGEFTVVDAVTSLLHQRDDVLLGPGDDAAILAERAGNTVMTTDMLVENRHFRCDWSSATDIGHKAVTQNLTDIAAMGASPTVLSVALGLPPDTTMAWVRGLVEGMDAECQGAGASIVGGDLVRSEEIIISITALGELAGHDGVTRGGAHAGDVVAVCGRLGWASAGYHVLLAGESEPTDVVAAHRRPVVDYEAGPRALEAGATAMCDVSDGLLADLGHIAQASSVAINVDPELLSIDPPVRQAGRHLNTDPLSWVLTGGDDYALVATFPLKAALPAQWHQIGAVTSGSRVTVGGKEYSDETGHTHF